MSKPDISIVTPTWKRRRFLLNLLTQVQNQQLGSLEFEHIVVSDGGDKGARNLAEDYGAIYHELEHFGSPVNARNLGIKEAKGDYIVFWDDDNVFHPHALITQFTTAYNFNMGINPIEHYCPNKLKRKLIPDIEKDIKLGNIDTMCLCLKKETALLAEWSGTRNTDARYVGSLFKHKITTNFVPVVIGRHYPAIAKGER